MADDPLVFAYPGNEELASSLCGRLGGETGSATVRRFPDGESYVRLHADPSGRRVIVAATLDHPDEKLPSLLFLASTARELGAARVELVAPYLCYMRQDARFQPGEAVTSREFASLISRAFDAIVTVDPHLHRYASLAEIYAIPANTITAAPLLGRWVAEHVEKPIVVGPDVESEQWAREVASAAGAPLVVLRKTRLADRTVVETSPDADQLRGRTPVLVDDIVSSAATMSQAIRLVRAAGGSAPVCLAVHAVFANDAYMHLVEAGAARIATTNTIRHPSNVLDVVPLIATALASMETAAGAPAP